MATDIIARGMAANAKKSVTELGNKVESEKWIGTKAEWEAVDKSTIKDGTIVYITDDKTVILYDKAEMEKIAAQVATDRKAAETAAQTAQAVADSLPEDYVTAVGKIAENTADIANVKLTDKELKRRVDALFDMGQGVTHKFETDTDTAYQKAVPTGGRLMSIKSIGGKNLVFNQIVNLNNFRPNYTVNGVTFTKLDNGKFVANGTATGGDAYFSDSFIPIKGHVYLEKSCPKGGSAETYRSYITGSGVVMDTNYGSGVIAPINVDSRVYIVPLMVKSGTTVDNLVVYPQMYDLTLMFGSGNEPSTVEEFEAIFPNDYYPYNAGEIVSAGTEEVAVGETTHPIPEAIRNLPGYGVEGNIVDYENKTYTQVNSVSGTEIVPLETPIVTDISNLIDDDFLRNLTVEAGGSITFKNSNDNYHIPVPSEEEYIVKLSEVGGTT